MPRSITIRDVPDETRDELAARAARSGRSLQEYLRARLVDLASRPDAEAYVTQLRARKAVIQERLDGERIVALLETDRR